LGRIEVERLYPAIETMPSLAGLPEEFRKEFFGSLDYAIFGRKLERPPILIGCGDQAPPI